MWDFSTDPEFQAQLDWADAFVRDEVEPLERLFAGAVNAKFPSGPLQDVLEELKQEVRDHGLWACHLPPESGGQGYGEVGLALLNEILGRSAWAPHVFATGPGTIGSGQSDVIAVFGTEAQKERWLYPLLRGEVNSCYSMTEPHAGADPTQFRCRAVRDGDEWVINGDKFFTSGIQGAHFIMLMAVTDPTVDPHEGMSMFIVDTDAPGVDVLWMFGSASQPMGSGYHPYVRYGNVRVPADHLLGEEGHAFAMAQRRLGAGRMHHAMRTVARCKKELDMMCERALSRHTQGSRLADKQMVQDMIADSYLQLTQFRLLVLNTAWQIDRVGHRAARQQVAACKVVAAQVARDISFRAMHIHGALGTTNAMPTGEGTDWLGIADGPTEVHKITVAKETLRRYKPSSDLWPSEFSPRKLVEARRAYDDIVTRRVHDDETRAAIDGLLQSTRHGNDEYVAKATEFLRLTTSDPAAAPYQPAFDVDAWRQPSG
jgi:acyl-CoA dehydrogenase